MHWYCVEVRFAYDGEPYGGEIAERLTNAIEGIVCDRDHSEDQPCPRPWWIWGSDVTEEVERSATEKD